MVALIAFSCKKDDDKDDQETVIPKSKTELLTSAPWKATAATVAPPVEVAPGIFISDFYAFMEACEKDNLIIFKADGTGMDDEGATKCDDNDPQIEDFTWSFNANETTITQSYEDDEDQVLTVKTLTETTLQVSFVEDDGNGGTYTITITGKHP